MPDLADQFAQALIAATKAGKLEWQPFREKDATVFFKDARYCVFLYDDAEFTVKFNTSPLAIGRSEELRDLVLEQVSSQRKREQQVVEALSFLQALAPPDADAVACAEEMLGEEA